MKGQCVIIAIGALAVGVAVGWFARGVGGTGNGERKEGASVAAKPKRKEPIRSAESEWAPPVEQPVEKPKENVVDKAADNGANPDNPFPRYVDMFRNNPAALVAEFEKEAEANRTELREMRDEIIRDWKLNEEEASLLEKALDDLCDEVRRMNEEFVGLIASGQLDDESAEDGSFMCGNHLLSQKKGEAVRTAFRETAEKLYEQLVPDGDQVLATKARRGRSRGGYVLSHKEQERQEW